MTWVICSHPATHPPQHPPTCTWLRWFGVNTIWKPSTGSRHNENNGDSNEFHMHQFSERSNIMRAIELDILPAWVHEDGLLFILGKVWPMKRVDEANDALARYGYDERLTWLDMPLSRQHTALWVDPAYLAAERWPESSVSFTEVEGWEQVFRVDVSDLSVPAPVPASAHAANGGAR